MSTRRGDSRIARYNSSAVGVISESPDAPKILNRVNRAKKGWGEGFRTRICASGRGMCSGTGANITKCPWHLVGFWIGTRNRKKQDMVFWPCPAFLELVEGFEPSTCWLRISCSTPEPHQRPWYYSIYLGKMQALFVIYFHFFAEISFVFRGFAKQIDNPIVNDASRLTDDGHLSLFGEQVACLLIP